MLTIELEKGEAYNSRTGEFIYYPAGKLLLEHSLRSISKWEGMHHKAFSSQGEMTAKELMDYIRCMTTNPQKDPGIYRRLTEKDLLRILRYMEDPHTAKTFPKEKPKRGQEAQTAEDYYGAMAYYGIPFECENWHFGRLQALIKTCEKQQNGGGSGGGAGKRMSFRETQLFYDQLNNARCKKLGTKG